MIENVFILTISGILFRGLAFSTRLTQSSVWKATVTPLASIMGSGFLVCMPLLAQNVGNLAIVAIAVLLLLAYLVGEAIRFNIGYAEPLFAEQPPSHIKGTRFVEYLSDLALTAAYFISISYYLQLLAEFILKGVGLQNPTIANAITTSLLFLISGIGYWRGLAMLENLEEYTVSLNLAMIAALVFGLGWYNVSLVAQGNWHLADVHPDVTFSTIRVLLGLLIVVQGFETSRYLGDKHPPAERIRTMRFAQLIASAVYLCFISLSTVLFGIHAGQGVTAVVDISRVVAPILPFLLIVAAIGSQFSAAVADSTGAGGLVIEVTNRHFSLRNSYLLILATTVILTWTTHILEIISIASRAFALYYTLQCLVALLVAIRLPFLPHRSSRILLFGLLVVVCASVVLLGLPAES